jgi:hypothetical protein
VTTSNSRVCQFFGVEPALKAEIDAAARWMYDAEGALHLARQAGADEWVATAYQHLHAATVEHTRLLGVLDRRAAPSNSAEHGAVTSLAHEFPALPLRIITAVVASYLPTNETPAELVHAARGRLVDALAA